MIALLDVNVLIALAWPNHIHHECALTWFNNNQPLGWATCPTTQSGFLRVSSNHRVIPEAKSPRESLALLQRIVELPNHVFWIDDVSLIDNGFIDATKLTGYRQITDAHLLALALRHEGRLATLDQGIRSLVPDTLSSDEVVCLLTEHHPYTSN